MEPFDSLKSQLLEATHTLEMLRNVATTMSTAVYLHEQKMEQMAGLLDAAESYAEMSFGQIEELKADDSSGQEGGGTGNA